MRILMLSRDAKILEEGSAVSQRMVKYGELCEELRIVVFSKKWIFKSIRQQLSKNVWAYSAWNFRKAMEGVKKGDWAVTTQDPFETGFAGWLIKIFYGLPLQIQIHTDFLSPNFGKESLMNRLRVIWAKFLIKKVADNIRAASAIIGWSLSLRKIYPKMYEYPIYIDVNAIANQKPKINLREKYSKFEYIILSLGRLSKEKNIPFLLKTFKIIIQTLPKSLLLIVGNGKEKNKIKNLIIKNELENNVIIEPWTNDPISYYKNSDVFVLTSQYEGYGRTLIEAMACKVPVVSTSVGLIRELPAGIAEIFEIKNEKELANRIISILTMPNTKNQLIQEGWNYVSKRLSEDETMKIIKRSWQSLFDNPDNNSIGKSIR